MRDLISRQAAIATAISGRVRTLPTTEDGENWIRVNEVRDSLLSLPSAERRGRWTDHSDEWDGGYYECSVCGEAFTFIEGTPKENLYNYCPNCGARMEETP